MKIAEGEIVAFGKIYPVNRGANEVQGLKAYSSVDVLPEPADLAILIIPAQ